MWPIIYDILLKSTYFWYQQGELPKPEKTKPGEKWGAYNIGDFLTANWLYLAGILLLVLIFIFYLRQLKKRQRD